MSSASPLHLAVVADYDVVVAGLVTMLEPYRDRIVVAEFDVAELDAGQPANDVVDIVLYDSFAQPESAQKEVKILVDSPWADRVVVYTWNFDPKLVSSARAMGVRGYLSKALPARDLVAALEAVHRGEVVISDSAPRRQSVSGLDWPGRREGLTNRESEVLALLTQGKSNAEVASISCVSQNTVKSNIRNLYRKIEVHNRTHAVL